MGWGLSLSFFLAYVCPITLTLLGYKGYSFSSYLYTSSKIHYPYLGGFISGSLYLFLSFPNTTLVTAL